MNKRHIKHTKPVDSAQVRSALISLLIDTLPLDLEARALDEETLWDILLYASFHQTTIEAACLELGVSSGTTTRNHLTKELGDSPSDLLALERQRNQALRTQLPRSFRKHLNRRRYDVALGGTAVLRQTASSSARGAPRTRQGRHHLFSRVCHAGHRS